jgi:hypothetical protein
VKERPRDDKHDADREDRAEDERCRSHASAATGACA